MNLITVFGETDCIATSEIEDILKAVTVSSNKTLNIVHLDERMDQQSIQDSLETVTGERGPSVFIGRFYLGGLHHIKRLYADGKLETLIKEQ